MFGGHHVRGDGTRLMEFIELPEGHTLQAVEVTGFLEGKTLRELDLRATSDLNVVGMRRKTSEGVERIAPDPKRILARGEIMLVVGPKEAVDSFVKAIS